MSKSELKELIIEYVSENVDPGNKEIIKKFDELLDRLELQNV